MCEMSNDCKLRERVDAIDERVTRLESTMTTGFDALNHAVTSTNAAVNQLAADFGARMNTLDARIVAEKEAWGVAFRSWLGWIVRLLVIGCAVAMGMTAFKLVFGGAP